jgi:preprotein translocase subunit SecA
MNEQRRVVYAYRRQILEGKDMSEAAREEIGNVIDRFLDEYAVGDFVEEWDLGELQTQLGQFWPVSIELSSLDQQTLTREDLAEQLKEDADRAYQQREQEFGVELMREVERQVLLQIIDNRWREHLYEMDYLREGIHLRGFAQKDPLVEYKNEGFLMFEEMMNGLWEEFARLIFHLELEIEGGNGQTQRMPFSPTSSSTTDFSYSGGGQEQPSALYGGAPEGVAAMAVGGTEDEDFAESSPVVVETRTVDDKDKVGRNDPCWCGSGKKFKKCHGA